MIIEALLKLIKESSNIVILSHTAPDGDSLGSSLAFYNAMVDINKKAKVIIDDDIPDTYKFLKGIDKIESVSNYDNFDLAVVLDCSDIGRLGKSAKYLENKKSINIDHHISNSVFGTYNLIDSNAAATTEIVYEVIKAIQITISKEIADCLYAGIVTDTGKFQYSNTTAKTHEITGRLLNYGTDPSRLNRFIYQNNSKAKLKLIGEAIGNLELYSNDRIGCIVLTKEQFLVTGAKDEDSEGIINFVTDIDTVEVALLFREYKDGKVKISFRSKNEIDVNALASVFGGGGHIKASGATVPGSISSVKEQVLKKVSECFR